MSGSQQAGLLEKLIRLLDSVHQGERSNALEVLHKRFADKQWNGFAGILDVVENTADPAVLALTVAERDQLRLALTQAANTNSSLVGKNCSLAINNKILASTLWTIYIAPSVAPILFGLGVFGVVVWLSWGSVTCWWDTRRATRAFGEVVTQWPWRLGESSPAVFKTEAIPYWVVVNGFISDRSAVDAAGRTIIQHCTEVYARRAQSSGQGYVPEDFLDKDHKTKWPKVAYLCRGSAERGYK